MAATEELVVRATMRDRLSPGLRIIRGEMGRVERAATRASRGSTGMERSLRALNRTTRSVEQGLQSVSRRMTSLGATAARGVAVGVAGASAAVATFGLRASIGFEQSEIALGALLGSAERGKAIFTELRELNKRSPFELPQITEATQLLAQFGITGSDLIPMLRSIGDVASLTTNPAENLSRIALAMGQISQAGVIRAQDLNQLVQAGFPALELLQNLTGMTAMEIREQMETGLELPASTFIDAVRRMQGPLQRFEGGMEKQALTLGGMFSTLKDTINEQLADAASPLAESLKRLMPAITTLLGTVLERLGPPVSRLLVMLTDFLMRALPVIEPVLTTLVDSAGRLLEAAAPAFVALAPVVDEIVSAMVELTDELVPVMPELVGAFVAFVGLLPDLLRMMADLVPLLASLARITTDIAEGPFGKWLIPLLVGGKMAFGAGKGVLGLMGLLKGAGMIGGGAAGAAGGAGALGGALGATGVGIAGAGGALIGTGIYNTGVTGGAEDWLSRQGWFQSLVGATPATPARGGGSSTSVTMQPGAVQVNNPSTNVDVSTALAEGIRQYERDRRRRG